MHKNPSHSISCPTVLHSAIQTALLASALALAGCSSTDNGGSRAGLNGGLPPPSNIAATNGETPLQTTLETTGAAADSIANANLGTTLRTVGKTLDGPLAPLYRTVDSTTQAIGTQTGLGQPVDGVLRQAGGAVAGLGERLGNAGLPSGLGEGTGVLVTGVGNAVASAGGLLNKNENNPDPLTSTLGAATGGIAGLTNALTNSGGLLQPSTIPLNSTLGGASGMNNLPILRPALTNAGQAVDRLLPLGLQQPLGNLGQSLDGVVSPVGGAVTQLTQKAGDGLGVGEPVHQLLTSLGGSLQQVGDGASSAVPGLKGAISGLGITIANAGGIVHSTPANSNPLGATLNSATQTVVALTSGLGLGGNAAGSNLLGGVTDGAQGSGSPLGGLLGSSNPVSGLLSGSQASGSADGPLAPVTGLLGGLLRGIAHK